MPIPLETATQLIHEINALVLDGVDHARLQLLYEQAEKLQNANFVAGKRVKGMIAALNFDRNMVRQEFSAALTASGGNLFVYSNYASALANLYDFVPAVAMIDKAVECAHDDATMLRVAMALHMDSYDVYGARELIRALRGKNALDASELSSLSELLDLIEAVLEDSGISWHDVCERILLASDILIQHGLSPVGRTVLVDKEGIFYRFKLRLPIDEVAAATSKMLDAIADKPFSAADRAICFSCEQQLCR